ncbi:hypothetical protein Hamer_G024799 [Homarus americanus]|uniref:Uncharacterized protein n=1 Tax=Homarus americanus TaxID=6706 RepID=A0A8J5K8T6_HOMAM|nr:hypothetical protein Hamer_G024799 [Homarus americanus]
MLEKERHLVSLHRAKDTFLYHSSCGQGEGILHYIKGLCVRHSLALLELVCRHPDLTAEEFKFFFLQQLGYQSDLQVVSRGSVWWPSCRRSSPSSTLAGRA